MALASRYRPMIQYDSRLREWGRKGFDLCPRIKWLSHTWQGKVITSDVWLSMPVLILEGISFDLLPCKPTITTLRAVYTADCGAAHKLQIFVVFDASRLPPELASGFCTPGLFAFAHLVIWLVALAHDHVRNLVSFSTPVAPCRYNPHEVSRNLYWKHDLVELDASRQFQWLGTLWMFCRELLRCVVEVFSVVQGSHSGG